MSEVPFHLAAQGKRFFEGTMSQLIDELARLNELLSRIAARLEEMPKG